jgi:pimeloyl-ACP methyl ester carboxylesterase
MMSSATRSGIEVLGMATFRSGDAQLFYEITGSGPDVVLLHPFPLNRHFWDAIVPQLSARYRVITPDLRAHGDSEAGDGPVFMPKLADDLDRLCRELDITRAIFVGVSIGGYTLFEFLKRYRERVAALVLANTRAGAETPEGRAARLQIAEKVEREGTAAFLDELLQNLFSKVTLVNRPDIVDAARVMARAMSPADIAQVQRGMAERADSTPTLAAINVPTLVIAGEDDSVPLSELELMHQRIAGSQLRAIPKAGHYASMEQPAEFGRLLRTFLDAVPRS